MGKQFSSENNSECESGGPVTFPIDYRVRKKDEPM